MRVLLAEDNASLARATVAILSRSGLAVEHAPDGGQALRMLRGGCYDVVVLDIMMPVMDGLEVLGHMREEGYSTPVIMLTAKTQVDDKVSGLDLGANDYVTKPFDARELVARIRAVARPRSGASSLVTCGDLVVNTETNELSTERGTLRVDVREARLAAALARSCGSTVEAGWLDRHVWEGEAMEGATSLYASFVNSKLGVLGSSLGVEGSDETGWRMVDHGETA